MPMMRSCVFGCSSSAQKCLRSSAIRYSSLTSEPASTSPPQTTSAISAADVEVVRADEAAVAHVRQLALDGGDGRCGRPPGTALAHRRAPAASRTSPWPAAMATYSSSSLCGTMTSLVEQVAELARLDRAGAHLGHRGGGEAVASRTGRCRHWRCRPPPSRRRGARCRSARRRRGSGRRPLRPGRCSSPSPPRAWRSTRRARSRRRAPCRAPRPPSAPARSGCAASCPAASSSSGAMPLAPPFMKTGISACEVGAGREQVVAATRSPGPCSRASASSSAFSRPSITLGPIGAAWR